MADLQILGFGAVAVDDLLYVEDYPPADAKVRVRQRLRQCGGLTGTALVAASRMGARCAYAGVLGDDELSQFVLEALHREDVDTRLAVRRPDARPAHSTIVVGQEHGTRTIFSSLGGAIGADPQQPAAEVIGAAAVILVDHHGLEGTLRAVRIARERGVGVVADFERDPGPPFGELLAEVDHLVVSDRFARQLTGLADPPASAQTLWTAARRAVVVTCGARGSWFLTAPGQPPSHCAAFPVAVVDTTGCGDVFHGAYAAALAAGDAVPRAVLLASAAAALKATHPGGQAGIPRRPAVESLVAQRLR